MKLRSDLRAAVRGALPHLAALGLLVATALAGTACKSDPAAPQKEAPASELVFTRGRSVAVRCAIRRSVRRGGRELRVIRLSCTHGGKPAVDGCFPIVRRMLENIAGPELAQAQKQTQNES